MRTGVAHIPLDYGTCPRWLFDKMTRLGRLITEAIVYEFGPAEFISRLSNPFFFQSFGSVLGFDWNSSGLTTTVCGALKYALQGTEKDLGIFMAGGKGKTSRKTPEQIEDFGVRHGLGFAPDLIYASKMSAKVDSAALQDGFVLYHHSFLFTSSGSWSVIQQGMNTDVKKARRYHWHAKNITLLSERSDEVAESKTHNNDNPSTSSGDKNFSFINEPHSAICSDAMVKSLNLVAEESGETRDCSVNLIKDNFNSLLKDLQKMTNCHPELVSGSMSTRCRNKFGMTRMMKKQERQQLPLLDLPTDRESPMPYLPFNYKRVEKILLDAKEKNPQDYEQLLGQTKVGPATLRALALVSEIVYGAKPSYNDPVRYSFAHGGKDGYPYPVDREGYEKSISILERAVNKAKIGQSEKMSAFRRLAR